MKRLVFCLFILTLLFQVPAYAVDVVADIDRTSVRVGEELRLMIKVRDAQGNVQAPRIPSMEGFDIYYSGRSSRLTLINGKSSSSLEFVYILVPQKAGSLSIQPIDIHVDSQSFRTEAISVMVAPGAPKPQTPAQQPVQTNPGTFSLPPQAPQTSQPAAPRPASKPVSSVSPTSNEDVYVVASVDKNQVYPNEQIVLTYHLYTVYDTRYEGFQDEPEVSGFWVEEVPMGQNLPRDIVTMNGRRYIRAEIKKMALFPTSPAEYTIQPGSIKVSIKRDPQANSMFDDYFNDNFFSGSSFFSRREDLLLKPQPIQVNVLPFPDKGKPKSFQGAAGVFRMSASIDKTSVKQDEPVTMKLIIEGEGNIETLNKPSLPELPQFRIYDGDVQKQMFKSGEKMGGKKEFEIIFIPIQAGKLQVPELEFSFFNPTLNAYQTLKTQSYPIDVAVSDAPTLLPQTQISSDKLKKDVELETKDIRFIHDQFVYPSLNQRLHGLNRQLAMALGILGILMVLLSLRAFFFSRGEGGVSSKGKSRGRASKGLGKLKSLAAKEDEQSGLQFYGELEKVFMENIAHKMKESPLGLTRIQVESYLLNKMSSQDQLYLDITKMLDACNEARFAKITGTVQHRQEFVQTLSNFLRTL